MFVLWTVYFIANISSHASTSGIIELPHYRFLVQTGLGGPHYLKTVVSRFMRQRRKPMLRMKYTILLEDLIEVH